MTYDSNNIFAKILRGELPCTRLTENEHALAFADINPTAPTHVLVIPKGAYIDFEDFSSNASDAEISGFMRLAAEVARNAKLAPGHEAGKGFRVISNAGAHGHQEVPHFHLHILGGRPLGPILTAGL